MPKRQNKLLALFLCLFSMFPAIDNQVDMQAGKILEPSGRCTGCQPVSELLKLNKALV